MVHIRALTISVTLLLFFYYIAITNESVSAFYPKDFKLHLGGK